MKVIEGNEEQFCSIGPGNEAFASSSTNSASHSETTAKRRKIMGSFTSSLPESSISDSTTPLVNGQHKSIEMDSGKYAYPAQIPLWKPNPETFNDLAIEKFRKLVNQKYSLNLNSYWDLHDWSIKEPGKFWAEVWDFVGILHSSKYTEVIKENASIDSIPKWFTGSMLNYAENLLEKSGKDDDVALYYKGEGHQTVESWTFAKLKEEVRKWSSALKHVGVQKGDVVAGILPNCPHTLAALLGTASLGATWTCTSPDYGTTGIVERFRQTEPKIIITVNAVYYNGKVHSLLGKLAEITGELPSVQKIVVIPFLTNVSMEFPNGILNWLTVEDFFNQFGDGEQEKRPLKYEQVPFDHPLFICYSSGTTGKPKCMVHSVGGTLLKHLEEHIFQSDLKKDDVMFYYTTTGWMMYNWLISCLFVGSPLVLYDGAPSPDLWNLIDETDITVFGTSAKWIAVQEDLLSKPSSASFNPEDHRKKLDKSKTRLRMVLSTGSPLKAQSFDFIYNCVKKDLILGSISGGTDIIGCFMGQNPLLPVHRGEIQSYHLGCDLDCFIELGQSVKGDRGELVVKTPFPSMPTHFHKDDENGTLYKKAYFSKFNGIWAHGDYMIVNPETRGVTMLGRSDATLNPNGVRFGSAEIYQVVEKFPEVTDSVCVGQRNKTGSDERVVLFLKLADGTQIVPGELILSIKKKIREELSPRHVPALILPIPEIPYTISGKKVEIAVRNVIEGEEVKNLGALANPNCLQAFKTFPELSKPWS